MRYLRDKVSLRITFLGTGSSIGVPVPGCRCPVCTSVDPRNQRLRPSLLIDADSYHVLIDTTPDLRGQLLGHRIQRIDSVLISHPHYDHLGGLPDIRPLRFFERSEAQTLPLYGAQNTLAEIRACFPYMLTDAACPLGLREIDPDRPFEVGPLLVHPIPLVHGNITALGFRFGSFAYLMDANRVPEESVARLKHLDLLVLDVMRDRPHPAHLSFLEAEALVSRLKPRRTLFTHISHYFEHDEVNRRLQAGVALAHDGMVIEL